MIENSMIEKSMTDESGIWIGPQKIPVWPKGQKLKGKGDNVIAMTEFEDAPQFHPNLIRRVLEMDRDPNIRKTRSAFASGTKIHFVADWGCPEADLINARALELYKRAFRQEDAVVHIAWANVSRRGDYTMPHSHPDSSASVVYCVDEGDPNPRDPMDGLLAIVDPRYDSCCQSHEGFLTTPFLPKMKPGSMIIFPSKLVHCVNPYGGERPRITFSWDINTKAVGKPRLPEEIRVS
ncbi:MAG: putative 2OG-Fe(II) oxygenase [Pseudomonadota bacterium]